MRFLRPLLGRPDVEVVLRSGPQGDLLRGLETLALDVVLTNIQPARDAGRRYLIQHLDEQPVSLIGTAGRIGAGASLRALLAREPLILPTAETAIRAGVDALIARLGVAVTIAAEVADMAMMRLLAREDAGLAVIPPIVVQDELASGRLLEAHRLEGIREMFLAVTLDRRFPNPLLNELAASMAP
jgi:LysR family transcriptional activator of nhaA